MHKSLLEMIKVSFCFILNISSLEENIKNETVSQKLRERASSD